MLSELLNDIEEGMAVQVPKILVLTWSFGSWYRVEALLGCLKYLRTYVQRPNQEFSQNTSNRGPLLL
jgi:hypothetical protein